MSSLSRKGRLVAMGIALAIPAVAWLGVVTRVLASCPDQKPRIVLCDVADWCTTRSMLGCTQGNAKYPFDALVGTEYNAGTQTYDGTIIDLVDCFEEWTCKYDTRAKSCIKNQMQKLIQKAAKLQADC